MFQYILCVGSSLHNLFIFFPTVVSIHLMCRFKICGSIGTSSSSRFQYILCVGSSGLLLSLKGANVCFNTSYVSVQESSVLSRALLSSRFNTSYVLVQVLNPVNTIVVPTFQYILCVGSSSWR